MSGLCQRNGVYVTPIVNCTIITIDKNNNIKNLIVTIALICTIILVVMCCN
ncbi:hypothetical protein VMF7928_00900 [Vibrio marisflavi CECT 7928]|uniref:Uncharacterized protein n=1 Tax=Vibrio marisflavi CECT 7928 TaxID=634439 RepID=A0ABN8DZB7_9VIBR|nr:hypothetical protein VMF7928_00900 [Vibrio marisflavi CECT 7928]